MRGSDAKVPFNILQQKKTFLLLVTMFSGVAKLRPLQWTSVVKGLTTWKYTTYPFERIHIDFCKIADKTLFVIFDTYSKWIEAITMMRTEARIVCEELRKIFKNFGLPKFIVSDDGPQFSSEYFIKFCESNGITVLKSPSYHPQSNGSAERAVQTVKQALKKSLIDLKTKHIP